MAVTWAEGRAWSPLCHSLEGACRRHPFPPRPPHSCSSAKPWTLALQAHRGEVIHVTSGLCWAAGEAQQPEQITAQRQRFTSDKAFPLTSSRRAPQPWEAGFIDSGTRKQRPKRDGFLRLTRPPPSPQFSPASPTLPRTHERALGLCSESERPRAAHPAPSRHSASLDSWTDTLTRPCRAQRQPGWEGQ